MAIASAERSAVFGRLEQSFELYLRAENKADKTIRTYQDALRQLGRFLVEQGMPTAVESISAEHVRAFIADQLARWKPATASNRYRALQAWFRWLVEEGELRASPMARMRPPKVPDLEPPVLGEDALLRLIKACDGPSFDARRDSAIIRLLLDTGMRRSECVSLRLGDVSFNPNQLHVLGKGRKDRFCPFGKKAALALDRYLRQRDRHQHAASDRLWLGTQGPLTDNGLATAIERRARAAGLDGFHLHLFRHTFAHLFLSEDGQETDLMQLAGWQSRQMLSRYARATAAARARQNYRKKPSPGDRF